MSTKNPEDLSQLSLLELFRMDVKGQLEELTRGILLLESDPGQTGELRPMMRATHSLKGAARVVNCDIAVRIAHAMEDCLSSCDGAGTAPSPGRLNALLGAVDLLNEATALPEAELAEWITRHSGRIDSLLAGLSGENAAIPERTVSSPEMPAHGRTNETRLASENLNRLLSMSGEILVAARWMDEHVRSLNQLKRTPQALIETIARAETFSRQFFNLSTRLHQEVLDSRMRPFEEALSGLPRMARDAAHALDKNVRLEIRDGATAVDRDVIELLKAPLMHLLRNAVDHGIEAHDVRIARGKPVVGTIRLEARHSGGMLVVSVSDDGNGIDQNELRQAIIAKHLNTAESVGRMSDLEIFQFLFLPGFTMKKAVTDLSGRGVGLDVVQTSIQQIGGTIRVSSRHELGTRFDLELPLTLSLIRALLVDIAGEAYAFPLARVTGVTRLRSEDIRSTEGRQHFRFRDLSVGLIAAHQLLEFEAGEAFTAELPVVVIGNGRGAYYGIAVDGFLGEREMVVLGLDPAIGKVRNISAGALMPDDSPVLILDIDDLLRSAETLAAGGRLEQVAPDAAITPGQARRKTILAVDDSLTVRELERKLLEGRGYLVETAVDGMDAWNTIRSGHFDLIVTDIDMPRMDGIELLTLIKKDSKLNTIPVMIVSYKDRDVDRRRGLDAGADYYLTKGSFQDESMLQAVADLIGEAQA